MAIETEMFRLLFLCHGKGVKLLGKGKGGYSYLAESGNNRYVLKQIHHEPCDYY